MSYIPFSPAQEESKVYQHCLPTTIDYIIDNIRIITIIRNIRQITSDRYSILVN